MAPGASSDWELVWPTHCIHVSFVHHQVFDLMGSEVGLGPLRESIAQGGN